MGADATAANYLAQRQAAADPIGAFTAGVNLRSNLQKIDLAAQAGQIDTLLNVVKLQNDQADQKRKNALLEKQMAIASYNAETNRINALRPRTSATSATGGGSIWDIIGSDENGLYFKGGPEQQGPTEGQGDGPEVQPLAPAGVGSAPDASSPSVQPGAGNDLGTHIPGYDPFGMSMDQQARQQSARQEQQAQSSGGSLFPQGGAMNADPSMAPLAGMGQPQTPPGQKNGRVYFDIDNININAKGQPSMSLKRRGAGKDEMPPIPTPQQLAALSAPYAHLGKRAVPDANNKRGFVFEDIPTMHGADLSISTLPAETQKSLLNDVNELIKLGGSDGPSDVAKMEAMGITVERGEDGEPTAAGLQKAGQEMRDKNLSWSEGFARAQKKNDNELIAKAATYALKLNASMEGKKGWKTKTAIDVINDIGLKVPASLFTPEVAQGQQPGARSVSVANVARGQGSDEMAAVTATAPVSEKTQLRQDENQGEIQLLRNEIAMEKNPSLKLAKQARLKQLENTQQAAPAKPSATSGAAPAAERDAAGFIVRKAPAANEDPKRQAANLQWDQNKKKVYDAMRDTVDLGEFKQMREGTQTLSDPMTGIPGGGESTEEIRRKWVEKNPEKLKEMGIKAKDGGPLKMDSVIFVDHTGRAIKLREVLANVFEDERFSHPEKAIRESAITTKGGNEVKVTVGSVKKVE